VQARAVSLASGIPVREKPQPRHRISMSSCI
jgi:hypothetical protein